MRSLKRISLIITLLICTKIVVPRKSILILDTLSSLIKFRQIFLIIAISIINIKIIGFELGLKNLNASKNTIIEKKNLAKDLKFDVASAINKAMNNYKQRNSVNIFRIYVDNAISFPLWAKYGFLKLVNPFTDKKYLNCDNFDLNEKNVSKALHLKSDNEINEYCSCNNYGLYASLEGLKKCGENEVCKDREDITKGFKNEGSDRINEIYELVRSLIPKDEYNSKRNNDKDNEALEKNYLKAFTKKNLENNREDTYFSKELTFGTALGYNVFRAIADFRKKKNVKIDFKNTKLSPLYILNIARMMLIKNAANNLVMKKTEESLEKYRTITRNELTADSLKKFVSETDDEKEKLKCQVEKEIKKINKNIEDIVKFKYTLNTLKKRMEKNQEENNKYKEDMKKLEQTLYNKKKDNFEIAKETAKILNDNKKVYESIYLEKNIFSFLNLGNEDHLKMLNGKIKEFEEKKDENLEKKRKKLMEKYEKIYDTLNKKKDSLINNLLKCKLLPENYDSLNEKGKKIQLEILFNKLKKLEEYKEETTILKKLKKETIKMNIPVKFRGGLSWTHYFNSLYGINLDFSVSYSINGFQKNIFMKNDFLQDCLYYLLKMHGNALNGKIINSSDINMDMLLYGGNSLKISDLVTNYVLKPIGQGNPFVGNIDGKDKYALTNYFTEVANKYTENGFSLCDIFVKIYQLNFCLKTGFVFNISNHIHKKKFFEFDNKNNLKNPMLEFMINIGTYYSRTHIQIKAILNEEANKWNKKIEDADKYFLRNMLEETLDKTIENLGLSKTENKENWSSSFADLAFDIKNDKLTAEKFPKNNKILGLFNNLFADESLPEKCALGIFNTSKWRPLIELALTFTFRNISISAGFEFIFGSPLNIRKMNKKYIAQLKKIGQKIPNSIKNFRMPFDILSEVLFHISFSWTQFS